MIDRKAFIKRRFGLDEPEIERIAEFKKHILLLTEDLDRIEAKEAMTAAELGLAKEQIDKLEASISWKDDQISQMKRVVREQASAIEIFMHTIHEQRGWRYCMKRLWQYFIN